jgi:DNA-binding HxlR family transcriptional regulator
MMLIRSFSHRRLQINEPIGALKRVCIHREVNSLTVIRSKTSPDRDGRLYGCPVELTLDLIGGKWKTILLARLKSGRLRYSELRRAVPDLADKVLTQRLHELQDAGLVLRIERQGAVHYSLSPQGASLAPALGQLYRWGETQGRRIGARFRAPAA